jgi:hypothetical protein
MPDPNEVDTIQEHERHQPGLEVGAKVVVRDITTNQQRAGQTGVIAREVVDEGISEPHLFVVDFGDHDDERNCLFYDMELVPL